MSERLEYDKILTDVSGIQTHMNRYLYALDHCVNKKVLDVGCGSGLGSFMYSMVAKLVIMLDYNMEALNKAKKFPFACEVDLVHEDLEKLRVFPKVDTIVALEVIEHLEDPHQFVKNISADTLVWSVPLNHNGEYHKYIFRSTEEVKKMFEDAGWDIRDIKRERNYLWGYCTK